MEVSQKALKLISHFEGRANYAYNDPVNVCTVGVGHALKPHRKCTAADFKKYGTRAEPRMTELKVDNILRRDLAVFESGVTRLLKRPTKQHEFDAMVSLAFNIGLGAFAKSTVLRLHNADMRYASGKAFLAWVFAGGRVLAGLQRRRRAERWLYRKGELRFFQ